MMIKAFFGFIADILLSIVAALVAQFILGFFGCYISLPILFVICFICKKFGCK